ncbi:MAG TPA: GtrA family protein [Thermoleophilaceae bacterium]|nr:GtrA family protein [Thermoleophilaceae bacterium]
MSSEPDTLSAAPTPVTGSLPLFLREARRGSNWAQLMRFAAVGAAGYAVNLAVYSLALGAHVGYRAAATVAFVVALVNNFAWNRLWTFRDVNGHLGGQALRFVVVSVGAFVVSLGVLSVLVRDAGVAKVLAQAIAIVAVTPVSFLANKLWSFGTSRD